MVCKTSFCSLLWLYILVLCYDNFDYLIILLVLVWSLTKQSIFQLWWPEIQESDLTSSMYCICFRAVVDCSPCLRLPLSTKWQRKEASATPLRSCVCPLEAKLRCISRHLCVCASVCLSLYLYCVLCLPVSWYIVVYHLVSVQSMQVFVLVVMFVLYYSCDSF